MGQRKTTKQFIEDAKKIHGDKYGYEKVIYVDCKTKVQIFCKKCNKYFWQIPKYQMAGAGCPDCGALRRGERPRHSPAQR